MGTLSPHIAATLPQARNRIPTSDIEPQQYNT